MFVPISHIILPTVGLNCFSNWISSRAKVDSMVLCFTNMDDSCSQVGGFEICKVINYFYSSIYLPFLANSENIDPSDVKKCYRNEPDWKQWLFRAIMVRVTEG